MSAKAQDVLRQMRGFKVVLAAAASGEVAKWTLADLTRAREWAAFVEQVTRCRATGDPAPTHARRHVIMLTCAYRTALVVPHKQIWRLYWCTR